MLSRLIFRLGIAGVLMLAVMVATPSLAQSQSEPSVQDLKALIKQLKAQLDSQTARNNQLEKQLDALTDAVRKLEDGPKAAPEGGLSDQQKAEIAALAPVKPAKGEMITIKGFISGTYFMQDQTFAFGNGQSAQWPVPPEHEENEWFSSGDVRNTRLTLGFNGPKLGPNLSTGGGLELDFFGGYNGSGAFSHQQPEPRLRLAYADLKTDRTTLRVGQFWSPAFGEVPVSLSHVAFPLGYGSAGMVGWRFPGVFLYHKLTEPSASVQAQLDFAVFEGAWSGPGSTVAPLTAGNVGFNPQVEARLNLMGKPSADTKWKLYLVAHWDEKDLRGPNYIDADANPDKLTGELYEIGGHFKSGPFLIHGNYYTSKAAGQQFTAITQFGDISDWGAWLQVGFELTDEWGVFAFHGIADPDDEDVLEWVGENGRVENQQSAFMLRWKKGQYQLGLEYLTDEVTYGSSEETLTGQQFAFSVLYSF